MKKSDLKNSLFGSAEYVVLHAQWKMRRGKNPSLSFRDQKNPRKALEEAKSIAEFSRKISHPKKDVITYEVIISLEIIGQYESFKVAISKFLEEIKAVIKKGVSWQWLETMNFIVRIDPNGPPIPMPFYEVRDFAIVTGLLKNGKGEVQPDALEPAPEIILQAYNDCVKQMGLGQLQELSEAIGRLHKKDVDLINELIV